MINKELKEELDRFEDDLMAKVVQSSNGRKGWLWNNVGIIASTLVILGSMLVAWGKIQAQIEHLNFEDVRLFEVDKSIEQKVDSHRVDSSRHTDNEFKSDVRTQLNEIRNLLVQHIEARR